jgi:hypothetical protein
MTVRTTFLLTTIVAVSFLTIAATIVRGARAARRLCFRHKHSLRGN